MTHKLLAIILLMSANIFACTNVPKGLQPVSEFEADRYMGKWYEMVLQDSIMVDDLNMELTLQPGEYLMYSQKKLTGFDVNIFQIERRIMNSIKLQRIFSTS